VMNWQIRFLHPKPRPLCDAAVKREGLLDSFSLPLFTRLKG
jgi:hypothetical protein